MVTLRKTKASGRAANGRGALLTAGVAAFLASTCCLGPLVLLMLGVSGAWIGQLASLEPYRPVFLGVAFVALGLAHRRVFRPVSECLPGEICAVPAVSRAYKVMFVAVGALLGVALLSPWVAPFFY